MAFKIEVITAFIAIYPDGEEGVMAMRMGNTMMPLVCADQVRLQLMYPVAEQIKKESGMDYKVIQFSQRLDVTEATKEKYKNEPL